MINLENFDSDNALKRLMRFLSVEGVSGQEKAIADEVIKSLIEIGVPENCIYFDDANLRIPVSTQTGNLIVNLPGTISGDRKLFCAHLDTVPLCAGSVPVLNGTRISPAGNTALGGDNRTGVACLVSVISTLFDNKLDYPPLTFLFTVREESGPLGARYVDLKALGQPIEGFNVDGGSPGEVTIGAVGAERWEVEIFGHAAHAGVHPERGVSSLIVASLAITSVHENGWFGKIEKELGKKGASNIGIFGGKNGKSAGDATNVVTDYVQLRGESRSHDVAFMGEITEAYKLAFEDAAKKVKNFENKNAEVRLVSNLAYNPFHLNEDSSCVQQCLAAARGIGQEKVYCKISNGGLDANWLVQHGIPTVTFGAGVHNIHTTNEYIEVNEFLAGCRMAIALAIGHE
jgi:tripeptide aminopeptidase